MTSDDKSLVIKSVSEKMNGIYTCEARRGLRLYSRVQLNVFCEWKNVLCGVFDVNF